VQLGYNESMIDLERLSRGQKLALLAAVPVILFGVLFVITFPGTVDYPQLPADIDPEIRARMLALRRQSLESRPFWHIPRVRMIPTVLSGLLALAGGLLRRPSLLLIGFVVGWFVPFGMGLYLLLSGWHATWVGFSELLYLVAAGIIWRERHAGS